MMDKTSLFTFHGKAYLYIDRRDNKHYVEHNKEIDQHAFAFWKSYDA